MIKCDICGKEYYIKPSDILRNKHHFCSRKCYGKYITKTRSGNNNPNWNSKQIICASCRKPFFANISNINRNRDIYCSNKCKSNGFKQKYIGVGNNNWNGGTTSLYLKIRNNSKMADWRNAVFRRDNYKDALSGCSPSRQNPLEAHHKTPFYKLLIRYNITTLEQAVKCAPLWDVNNGITLLRSSHRAYHDMYGNDYE
jgi:endogenous inhibitor of DNA gyrase (YacG/DUF329 family)